MRYLEHHDLVDGESYVCQTYDGDLVCCHYLPGYKDRPFELMVDSDTTFSAEGDIRYVFETTNEYIARFR